MTIQKSALTGLLPAQVIDGITSRTKTTSTIAALSEAEPMKFGDVALVTFDQEAVAEFVEESGAKSSQDIAPAVAQAVPHKAQVSFRTSDEFLWADEDYRLGILDKFAVKAGDALSKALDLGAYYRINPKTGNEISAWTNYVNATTKRSELGTDSEIAIEAAVGALLAGGVSPTGIALAPGFTWNLATLRYADGRKKFPELGYNVDVTSFGGLRASTSSTVQGKARDADATDNKVRAIIGDFRDGIRWGIQKRIPFHVIPYGDPDNSGRDLAGHNEVLLRAEVVYAWHAFMDRFAVVEDVTP